MKPAVASTFVRRTSVAVVSVLALAACGSSGSSSTTSAAGSATTGSARYQARLNLAKCLRSHGLNVPDPSAGGGVPNGAFRVLRQYPQSEIQSALQSCRQYLVQAFPRLNLSPAQRAQLQQQAVKFAECMRSHGIDVPDPTFNSGGGFGIRRAFGSIDRNSPAFRSALQACQSLRPRFGRIAAGGGPGG